MHDSPTMHAFPRPLRVGVRQYTRAFRSRVQPRESSRSRLTAYGVAASAEHVCTMYGDNRRANSHSAAFRRTTRSMADLRVALDGRFIDAGRAAAAQHDFAANNDGINRGGSFGMDELRVQVVGRLKEDRVTTEQHEVGGFTRLYPPADADGAARMCSAEDCAV